MTLVAAAHGETLDGGRAPDRATFFDQGFLAPIPLMTDSQRALLLNHLTLGKPPKPSTWSKGRAANDRLVYDIATHPTLIGILRQLLGENIILWGAGTVERKPGRAHEWHVDIESADPRQRFASVWIGLRNTSRESGLNFVARSHRFGKTIQEVQHDHAHRRGEAADETILAWAKKLDPLAELQTPDVHDGEALIFHGGLWHGSLNRRESGTRLALLLQYASSDAPVFMPDPSRLEWPFSLITSERPPVIVVSGKGNGGGNRQVNPPPTSPPDATRLTTEIRQLDLPLRKPDDSGWRPHPLFKGLTGVHDFLSCHASVLSPGATPHPPHAHIEEEILIVLDGEAELLIGDGPEFERAQPHPAGPGTFVYYPAYQHHTLRNAGTGPLSYLMFKWRGAPSAPGTLATQIVDSSKATSSREKKQWRTRLLLEGPTNFLGKLHAHGSEVDLGGGYEPHEDDYDVAIVVLSGAIETLGRRVEPFGVVFYAAGEPHGLRCVSSEPARYIVFEFHGGDGGTREKTLGKIPRTKETKKRKGKFKSKKTLYQRLEKLVMAPIRHFTKRR